MQKKSLISKFKLFIFDYYSRIISNHINISIFLRRAILLIIDQFLLIISFVFSYYLNFDNFSIFENKFLLISLTITSGFIFILSGQYKALTRYTESKDLYPLILRSLVIFIINLYLNNLLINKVLPLKVWFFSWINFSLFLVFSRLILKDIIISIKKSKNTKLFKVVIIGTGSAAVQLSLNLKLDKKYNILAFIDQSPYLWGKLIQGIQITSLKYIFDNKKNIDKILLAIPDYSLKDTRLLLKILNPLKIPILEIPSVDDLFNGRAKIDTLRPLLIEDLLCRETMPAIPKYLFSGIKNNIVLVTGAGGSIGSELCKQILKLSPASLIMLDNSEPNLYKINQYLQEKFGDSIEIIPILGDASSSNQIKNTFNQYKIDVVFHAAAYKHVPLVEINPISGIKNNVISTLVICDACRKNNCKNMILISSDKAVRPTNIMGASKRLSELIVQAYASEALNQNCGSNEFKTYYSMVRFGNVLGSSGSVVPLFKDQILKGGPITLTDKRITRYFMTIQEATLLVIQSTHLAKGGEVFLLDMGEPVLINDLAIRMINLSGLEVKNKENPEGDIEICEIGLRPGEKLYEELLIDGDSKKTEHPLIYIANEKFIEYDKLMPQLDKLKISLDKNDKATVFSIISNLVQEWEKYKF